MNAMAESPSLVSKRSTSPRPPAVGEEVKKFYDTSHNSLEPNKNWNMEFQSKASCGEYGDRSVTPAFSESIRESAEYTENSPNSSPPAPYKWAQSLLCLLEDIQGVSLFQQFLKQEGQDMRCLSFWFACRGVKKHDSNDRDGLVKLINVVFEKKVKRISAISDETKEEIRIKLSSNSNVDDTIFDAAQLEVEAYMMKTTYPNFLRSDLYIQHLGGFQNEFSSEKECTVSPEPVDVLPTLHEDSELQITCNKIPLTKNNLLLRSKILPESKLKPEGPAGYLRSPYSNYSSYHSKYGSFLHASAQNSELQSLSSDAQTDDTMSLTDGSVDYSMHNRSKQKRSQQRVSKQNIIKDDKLSLGTFIPRTQQLPESMQPKSQKEFHSILIRKLEKVVDEQRMKDKIYERLKMLESTECPKPEMVSKMTDKSNAAPRFEHNFLCAPSEENVQDILDQHISRVFEDSEQHTPASERLSPPVARPTSKAFERSRVPPPGVSCEPLQDVSFGASHKQGLPQFNAQLSSMKHRKDHDTHSTDSAMFDCVSDDNMAANYRSQYSSMANSELVDSRRSREHSKRNVSKKFSLMTDSSSSFVDSGISLACESVPSYSKVTHWLETKRLADQEREQHMFRNSSTSPVLNRSSRKAVSNSSRSGTREVSCSQWTAISCQVNAQESSVLSVPPPDITSNLLEARKRLEDDSRAKLKLKNASGCRNSHDAPRMKFPKAGYDSFDDGVCHRKFRKSYPTPLETPASTTCNDVTVIGYSYGRRSVPYLSKIPGKNITLRHFKSLLSKKGNFRYFFKTASNDFGTGVVFEEVTDDSKVLPMWEGKVFCVIESMEDNSV